MKLIVGLGNPGPRYEGTRHNVGFAVLAEVARKYATGRPKRKFQGEVVEADLEGVSALLLSPTTYMNHSGASVQTARDFYKLPDQDLLVICDDLNLPLAKLRFRAGGSSGWPRPARAVAINDRTKCRSHFALSAETSASSRTTTA